MYFEHEKRKPKVNELVTRSVRYATELIESYYDLAEAKDLSDEKKQLCNECAAEVKAHICRLQELMGPKGADKPEEEAEPDEDGDEFLKGLGGDSPKPKKGER